MFTGNELQFAAMGALAALTATTALQRLFWSGPRSAAVQDPAPPAPSSRHGPHQVHRLGKPRSADPSATPSDSTIIPAKQAAAEPTGARMFVNAPEQVREFLDWMTRNGFARAANCDDPEAGRSTSEEWFESYSQWATRCGIVVLPDTLFLANLAKHPRIKRSRPRAKCPLTGRCLKNEAGKEIKITAYTLFERAPVEAVMRDPVTGRAKKVLVAPDEVKVVQRQLKRAA